MQLEIFCSKASGAVVKLGGEFEQEWARRDFGRCSEILGKTRVEVMLVKGEVMLVKGGVMLVKKATTKI